MKQIYLSTIAVILTLTLCSLSVSAQQPQNTNRDVNTAVFYHAIAKAMALRPVDGEWEETQKFEADLGDGVLCVTRKHGSTYFCVFSNFVCWLILYPIDESTFIVMKPMENKTFRASGRFKRFDEDKRVALECTIDYSDDGKWNPDFYLFYLCDNPLLQ